MASESRNRLARILLVVVEVFPEIIRELIKSCIPYTALFNMIQSDLPMRDSLTSTEQEMVKNLSNGYSGVDTIFVCKVIRHFRLLPPPTSGKWGKLPLNSQNSISDDVERIRNFRNEICHRPEANVTENEMQHYFTEFIGLGNRFDSYFSSRSVKTEFEKRISLQQTMCIDPEMENKYIIALERISELKLELKAKAKDNTTINIFFTDDVDKMIKETGNNSTGNEETVSMELRIYGVKNELDAREKIETAKELLNEGRYTLQIKETTTGSLIISIDVIKAIFNYRRTFLAEMCLLVEDVLEICEHDSLVNTVLEQCKDHPHDEDQWITSFYQNSEGRQKCVVLNVDVARTALGSCGELVEAVADLVRDVAPVINEDSEGLGVIDVVVQAGEDSNDNHKWSNKKIIMNQEIEISIDMAKPKLCAEEDITPGLTCLNLNIMFENDISLIQDAIQGLQQRIEDEHSAVHNVLNNMIAILKSKFNRGKIESRGILETILKQDPKNLNVLADLEQLCRDHHRITEADNYKMRIDYILEGNALAEKRAKATCLMEQGYAILYEESANKEQLSKDKLSESYRMLLSEQRKAMGNRKDYLQRCIYHNKQVLEQLQQAIESKCKSESDLLNRRTTSIEKFNQAKKIFDLQSGNPIWLYYEGVAWNRSYDSLREIILSGDEIDRQGDKINATFKATEFLWKVANWPDDDDKIALYKSRALALIAHILTAPERNRYFLADCDDPTSFRKTQCFVDFIHNPMRPIEIAWKLHPNDVFILNRYGRILWNKSVRQGKSYEKKERLHEALRILNKSIEKRYLNWFAYTTRMSVQKDLAMTYLRNNVTKAETFLKLAFNDGKQCFITRGTSKTLCILVDICQYLAKFPNVHNHGCSYVVQEKYLLDAIDYLQFGIHQEGPSNYFLAYRMALILYDLHELKSATCWMWRALSLSNKGNTMPYKLLCLYILERYREAKEKKENTTLLLKEFLYTLENGYKRYVKIDIICYFLCKNDVDNLLSLFEEIISIPQILDQSKLMIVSKLLDHSINADNIQQKHETQIEDCKSKVSVLKVEDIVEPNFSEMYQTGISTIPTVLKEAVSSEEYKYDFFVSYSRKDRDWVENRLLADLETSLSEEDQVFHGCIADRDFTPGQLIIENILNSIKKSAKILLVLSENFVKSNWCQFETDHTLISSLNVRRDCVIPLLLEDCQIPEKLHHITYADFTDDAEYIHGIMKLKRALLPDGKSVT